MYKKVDRLCGLVVRVTGYKTYMYCASCEVRTEFIYVMEKKLRVFENRVLRRISGQKRDEVMGEWRKLDNKELHDFYSSPSIIRIIMSRRMRWEGHVARIGRRGTFIDYWWESQRERGH
jgi:hypothetical protein